MIDLSSVTCCCAAMPSVSISATRLDRRANSVSSALICSPREMSSRCAELNCVSDDMIFCSRICIAAVFTFRSWDVVSNARSLVRSRLTSSWYCCSREPFGGGCNHLPSVLIVNQSLQQFCHDAVNDGLWVAVSCEAGDRIEPSRDRLVGREAGCRW